MSLITNSYVSTSRIIYTASAFAKSNLVYLQETGMLTAVKPHISRRNNLHSYLFFIVTDGEGTVEYDGETVKLKKDSCIFIDCRKPYSQQSSSKLWTLKWIHFNGQSMAGIYNKYLERGGKFSFNTKYAEEYKKLIDEIYGIANSNSYVRDMEIFSKLTVVLKYLMEESWNPQAQKFGSKRLEVENVKTYIDCNYTEKITLDCLSEKFFIDKYYLSKQFKNQFGLTVNNYIISLRVTKAKNLLRFSKLSLEQIGIAVGMESLNYFIRAFKKVEGVTPGEYRKNW